MMKTTEMAIVEAKARGYDPVIVDESGNYWEETYSGDWAVLTEIGWEVDAHAFDGAEVIRENYCDEEKICYINVAGEFPRLFSYPPPFVTAPDFSTLKR